MPLSSMAFHMPFGGETLQIFILDTDDQAINTLKSYLSEMEYLSNTMIFIHPEDMLEAYRQERPGMLFIRVGNPQINGIWIARQVRVIDNMAKVVFISKYKAYAELAWETGAVDFLLEPIRYERFMEALARAG